MGNGSSKHGDAIGDKLRDRFARNRAERRRARERLESLPDDEDAEITAEHIIEAVKVGAAAATGKHTAMPANNETKPEEPKPDSTPPKARFALRVLEAVQPPWLRAVIVLAAIAAATYLVGRGVRLWP